MRVRWTPLHDVWLAVAYPGFSGWLRDWGLVPRVNLGGADLSCANLRGANLCDADLNGANLGDWERGPYGYARRKATP